MQDTVRNHLPPRERIVVGLDNSPAGAAALQWAFEEAARCDAAITVVSAFDVSTRSDLGARADLDYECGEHQKDVIDWVSRLSHSMRSDVTIKVATPRAAVLDALADAAKGARCVVVGQPQDARLRELPTRLAGRCLCPVLILNPDDPTQPVPA